MNIVVIREAWQRLVKVPLFMPVAVCIGMAVLVLCVARPSCSLTETTICKRFPEPCGDVDVVLVFFGQPVFGKDSYRVAVVRHNREPRDSDYIFDAEGIYDPEDITLRWFGERRHLVITVPPTAQVAKQDTEIRVGDEVIEVEYKEAPQAREDDSGGTGT